MEFADVTGVNKGNATSEVTAVNGVTETAASKVRTPTLEDAIALATRLHQGQTDKAGADYIHHPLRVMNSPFLRTDEERMAGVLHDVLEDCDITREQLLEAGYPPQVVEAVASVSKLPEEEGKDEDGAKYRTFISRVAQGPELARRVKLADLADNMDLSRVAQPTQKDHQRTEKYRSAFDRIEATLHAE